MSGQSSLFGDDEPTAAPVPVTGPSPIADWQIALVRKALDARSLISMQARQQAVEDALGRTVTSLRSLTSGDGIQLLSRLAQQPVTALPDSSAWDDREKDTWIDRL